MMSPSSARIISDAPMKPMPTMGSFHRRTARASGRGGGFVFSGDGGRVVAGGLGPQGGEEIFVNEFGFLRLQQASGHEETGKNGEIDFISHVSHWMEFPSARSSAAKDAAVMDGRSTPVRALTQMTKLQKATDSGTPA